jgi:hypothetical protein
VDQLSARVAELESELTASQAHADRLAGRLNEAQHETEQAIERLREEAEARDRAEARAAGGAGPSRVDDPARPGTDDGAERDAAVAGRLATLEEELRSARHDADDLSSRLIEARRDADDAADRYKREVEARMRAESDLSRLQAGAGEPLA